ncbi:MAG: ribonuclease [Microbacteriaceae bacterium]|nr:ribonuclease [Microbacteriaceae bacterium]
MATSRRAGSESGGGTAENQPAEPGGLKATIARIVAAVQRVKVVRVFQHFAANRGPLLAGGLSYQAIFAVFAALWVGFSVAGLFLQAQPDLRAAFFGLINNSIPGLIKTGPGTGAIDPKVLLETPVLSWTGAIALVGLLLTALGWLASCRDAVRTIFDLPGLTMNFALLKLKDLAVAIGYGAALIVSAALTVFSTQAIGAALDLFGVGQKSIAAILLARTIGLVLMLALDTAVLASMFRLLSGLKIPAKRLWFGSLLGAVGLGVLKVLGSSLLGGASRNPLLASFAVIIGLLVWFNLICQVILLAASWISVGIADDGVILDPARAEAERDRAAAVAAEAGVIAAARHRPWIARIFSKQARAPRRPRQKG